MEALRAKVKELETKLMKNNAASDGNNEDKRKQQDDNGANTVEDEISKALLTEMMERELQIEKLKTELDEQTHQEIDTTRLQLERQMKISESLQSQVEATNEPLKSKQKIIDQQAGALREKE